MELRLRTDRQRAQTNQTRLYRLSFFTAPEYVMIGGASPTSLSPTDNTPGAREAGVSEFIDLIVSRDPDLRRDFRTGLDWLNTHSEKTSGLMFLRLNPDQQMALLESLAYKREFRPGEERGRGFFALIREYTVMAFLHE